MPILGPIERIYRAAKTWTGKRAAISGFGSQRYEDSHAAAAAHNLSEFAEDGLPEQRRLNLDLRIAEGAVLRARFPLLAKCFGREQPFLIRRHLIQWASWVVKAFYEVIRDWPLPDDRELAALAKEGGGAYCDSVESRERCELAQVVMPPYIPNIDETPKKLAIEEARRAGDLAVVLPLINELDAEIETFVNEAACWPRSDVGPSRTERVFQAANRLGDLVGSEIEPGGEAAAEGRLASDKEPAVPDATTYTVAALRDMTGLGNEALNRYAKDAKVKTPGRGQRNFRYPSADVCTILRTIVAESGERATREKCKTALNNLREISK